MNIHAIYAPLLRHFRTPRIRRMYGACGITRSSRVLDIGGTEFNWELARELGYPIPQVTILNLHDGPAHLPASITWERGDARALRQFADGEFDLAVSNSVIEHLHCYADQKRMAHEACRVATRVWVQTPDPRFPLEPHYLTPFVHWLAPVWRRRLAPYTVWGLLTRPSRKEIAERIEEIRLVNHREMQALFPHATIVTERFLGWPKSLIATQEPRDWPPEDDAGSA